MLMLMMFLVVLFRSTWRENTVKKKGDYWEIIRNPMGGEFQYLRKSDQGPNRFERRKKVNWEDEGFWLSGKGK